MSLMEMFNPKTPNGRLMQAIRNNDVNGVKELFQEGADANRRIEFDSYALVKAGMYGRTEIARLLIENGADVNATDNDRQTALDWAKINGYRETARLLVEMGATGDKNEELIPGIAKTLQEIKKEVLELREEVAKLLNKKPKPKRPSSPRKPAS